MKLIGGNHFDFVLARKIEIGFVVDLPAQANLQKSAFQEQAFFDGAAEGRAVGILAAEIFISEIVVGVELD